MSADPVGEWTQTEIAHGRFTMANSEGYEIKVYSDFSGYMMTPEGGFVPFADLRVLIDAAKILEKALTEHYGGYK